MTAVDHPFDPSLPNPEPLNPLKDRADLVNVGPGGLIQNHHLQDHAVKRSPSVLAVAARTSETYVDRTRPTG